MTWSQQFNELFERCLKRFQSGDHQFNAYYTEADLAFLASIGYKPRELFDFVEDLAQDGDPAQSDALLVAAVRRDYFRSEQSAQASSYELQKTDLPTFGDEIEGIYYLPRILKKAQFKLKGELDPDIMYGCGGDRKFLRENGNIHPADFLKAVWKYEADPAAMVSFVRSHTS